jgi:hypothetical protein
MDRRQFFQTAGGAVALAEAALAQRPATPQPAGAPRKATMHVGTQHSDSDEVLTVMSSLGVNHICSGEVSPSLDEKWSVDGL